MIAVCNIILIRNSWNDAKTLLETFGKLVCGGFHRSAIYRVADVLSCLPLGTFVIEALHNLQRKRTNLRVCMRLAVHSHAHLMETCISK